MFYPTAGSDDVFLIAIAMIAGIVVLIMVVATFILLRSENKKENPKPPIDEIQSIPPAEPNAPSLPEEKQIIDLPSTPAAEIVAVPREARPKIELHLSPRAIRLIRSLWGIFLTTALMFAVTLAIAYFIYSRWTLGAIILLVGLPFGTALAGTVGVRLTHLEWRLMFVPVLLFVAGSFLLMTTLSYANNPFLLLLAAIGSVFVPLMNREVKQVGISITWLNWVVCLIIASFLAYWGFLRLRQILAPPLPIPAYFYWFAISLAFISPACIAVAWLRLTGTRWLRALLLIPFVPVGFFIILLMFAVIAN